VFVQKPGCIGQILISGITGKQDSEGDARQRAIRNEDQIVQWHLPRHLDRSNELPVEFAHRLGSAAPIY